MGVEEAIRQSEETANALRATTAASLGGQIVNVDRVEVVVDALGTGAV